MWQGCAWSTVVLSHCSLPQQQPWAPHVCPTTGGTWPRAPPRTRPLLGQLWSQQWGHGQRPRPVEGITPIKDQRCLRLPYHGLAHQHFMLLGGAVALGPSPRCWLSGGGGGILDGRSSWWAPRCAPQPGHPPPPSTQGTSTPGAGLGPRPPAPVCPLPEWRVAGPSPVRQPQLPGGPRSRASHGQRWPGGAAEAAGGTAGPPRWLCPLEGKRAPHKRGGAAAPAPQPPAPASPALAPATGGGMGVAAPWPAGSRPGAAAAGSRARSPRQGGFWRRPEPSGLRPSPGLRAMRGEMSWGGHCAVGGEAITSNGKGNEAFGHSRNWARGRHGPPSPWGRRRSGVLCRPQRTQSGK